MDVHTRVQVGTCGEFLDNCQLLQVVHDDLRLCQNHDLRLLWVEGHFLKDSPTMDEVCLSGCLAESMDRNHLVLLWMVGTHRHKIVTLAVLKLYMSHICLELKPNSETLSKLFWLRLIKIPLVSVISEFWLVDDLLRYSLTEFREFPNHYLNCLSMTESN